MIIRFLIKVIFAWSILFVCSCSAPRKSSKVFLEACKAGDTLIVKQMISQGVNINTTDQFGYTGLHLAVTFNEPEVVSVLLKKGANYTIKDRKLLKTPLEMAEEKNNSELIAVFNAYGNTYTD